jgi:pimeloyl-ACP methyl ester carboxylesterase
MTIVNLNNNAIHYSDTGSGDVIVFVHGLGAGFNMWAPQIQAFSDDYRVIAINVRGVGKSGKLAGWKHILERQVDDLKLLLDYLHIEKAVICGVSYGGVFTQQFYLTYPDKCKAIAIIDSYSTTKVQNFKELLWLINVYMGAPSNLLPRKWLSAIMKNLYKRWSAASQIMGESIMQYRGYEAMKTRMAINNIDFIPGLKQVNVPVLCAVGTQSWWLSIPFMIKCAQAIPTCKELTYIPDAYDPSNLCQVDKFNEILFKFLSNVYS